MYVRLFSPHAAFWARDTELLQEIFLRPASIDSMAPGLVSFM
jgi:hypothetical protein